MPFNHLYFSYYTSLGFTMIGFSIRFVCCLALLIASHNAYAQTDNAQTDNAQADAPNDHVRKIQSEAIEKGNSPVAHWGWEKMNYKRWSTHSNRLIPVYTYGTLDGGKGIDLTSYTGSNSVYRSEQKLSRLYHAIPAKTVSSTADYLDQTNIFEIQRAALEAGKKNIFLVVFDGMDWQTTRAAAIHNLQKVAYEDGRGTGTHFQDYTAGGTTQFGYMVTSPHSSGGKKDVNNQTAMSNGTPGGYDPTRGGATPWATEIELEYLGAEPKKSENRHAYTDSASSAVSMTAGIKTYNGSINITHDGTKVATIAQLAQQEGYAVGAVSSVPICHATPACSYAHNVSRSDYQDISRDMLGLPSKSHPKEALDGLDVVIGAGYGSKKDKDEDQGKNFVPGNRYITDADIKAVSVEEGGKYIVVQRTEGKDGKTSLLEASREAAKKENRLLGFFGTSKGHLPFETANGDYNPTNGRDKKSETYTDGDVGENPELANMAAAALHVLSNKKNAKGIWLMVESGDVDWANHDNNIDNSIGAVNSGDRAVKVITDWVERCSNWEESLLIVTADHGHMLILENPAGLVAPK
jgi:alkaline phosphatase